MKGPAVPSRAAEPIARRRARSGAAAEAAPKRSPAAAGAGAAGAAGASAAGASAAGASAAGASAAAEGATADFEERVVESLGSTSSASSSDAEMAGAPSESLELAGAPSESMVLRRSSSEGPPSYTGDGEEVEGVKYIFPVPPPAPAKRGKKLTIPVELLTYESHPSKAEFATVCLMAPFYCRDARNARVIPRPCRWLPKQLGVFLFSPARVEVEDVLIVCHTPPEETAGGYRIMVPWKEWMVAKPKMYSGIKQVEFFVSPRCPSIYINSGDSYIWGSEKSNVTWAAEEGDAVRQPDGGVKWHPKLVVKTTKPIRGMSELLIPYGWSPRIWNASLKHDELLMDRFHDGKNRLPRCPVPKNKYPEPPSSGL